MKNPYLDEVNEKFKYVDESFDSGFDRHSNEEISKWDMIVKYSFAIPNEEAIGEIVENSPLIEIGAGSGYWAYLIDEKGGNILAFDNKEREYNKYWYNVKEGDHSNVKDYSNRTLFLCWPEYDNPMGIKSLKNSNSKKVIVVGERDGCTGDDKMRDYLNRNYKVEEEVLIPQWLSNRDYLTTYLRI